MNGAPLGKTFRGARHREVAAGGGAQQTGHRRVLRDSARTVLAFGLPERMHPLSWGRTVRKPRSRACGGAPDQGTGEARRSGAGSRGSATFRPLRVLRRLPRFRAYPAG